ncbi:MAG: protein TolR [Proteobacteria bacterium]|nr:protein TolR [Pseudomonadota bacterium]
MAGNLNQFRYRSGVQQRHRPMSEINVTPFVDVMLVLLVVFMITAPLLTVGVPIDLPKTAAPTVEGQDEPLAITINAQGLIFLQETEVQLDSLVQRLVAITKRKPNTRIFVRGDETIEYGRVMQVMGTITAAGFTRVALITDSRAAIAAQNRTREGGKRQEK